MSMHLLQKHRLIAIALVIVTIFLFWSRFFMLHLIPSSIPHDELVYAVQAMSYSLQGTTLDQAHHWWQITPFDPLYAELPATLMSVGFLFSKNALIGSHLTSALMGVLLPFLLGWLTYNIWHKPKLSICMFVLAVFNPLLWQFSRFGYDAFYSLFFYVLGAALLTHPKLRISIWSLPVFFIGFFNYQGMKLLLVPWLVVILALLMARHIDLTKKFHFKRQSLEFATKYKLQILALVAGVVLTLIYGLFILPNQSTVNRLSSTIFSDSVRLAEGTNMQRRLTIENPAKILFANKGMETLSFTLDRLLSAYNPIILFMLVEPDVSGFSVWMHGIFYWFEGLLFMIGAFLLLINKRWRLTGLTMIFAVVILSIPTLINTGSEWHLLRTMLGYLILLMIAAWGFYWLMFLQKRRSVKLVVLIFYILNILQFTYIYFYRFPILSLDWGNFYERETARYVALAAEQFPEEQIDVRAQQSDYYFWAYLVYSGELNPSNLEQIAATVQESKIANQRKFSYKNLTFSPACYDPQSPNIQLVENEVLPCLLNENGDYENTTDDRDSNSFVQIIDSGVKIKIYNDKLCEGERLDHFIHLSTFAQLGLENMDKSKFCQTWVTNQ